MPRPEAGELADEPTDPVVEQAKPAAPAPEPVVEEKKPKREAKPKPDPKPEPETKPEAPAPEAEPAAAAPAVQAIEVRKRLAVRDELFGPHEIVFKKGDIVRGKKAERVFELHPADVVVIR